jgi:hypothetical protein
MYLAIDIGLRNLGFCVLNADGTVQAWELLDLIKLVGCRKISDITFEKLHTILIRHLMPLLSNLQFQHVGIETQPLRGRGRFRGSPKMWLFSHLIYFCFASGFSVGENNVKSVRFVDARRKYSEWMRRFAPEAVEEAPEDAPEEGPETKEAKKTKIGKGTKETKETKGKGASKKSKKPKNTGRQTTSYSKRKALSVCICRGIAAETGIALKGFESHKKKDDLADALLLAIILRDDIFGTRAAPRIKKTKKTVLKRAHEGATYEGIYEGIYEGTYEGTYEGATKGSTDSTVSGVGGVSSGSTVAGRITTGDVNGVPDAEATSGVATSGVPELNGLA